MSTAEPPAKRRRKGSESIEEIEVFGDAPLAGEEDLGAVPASQSVSSRPPAQSFALTIKCIIPRQESTRTVDWDTNRIFYKLEKDYGRPCVLSHDGREIMKFKNAYKAGKDLEIDPTALRLKVSTERQLQEIQHRMRMKALGEEVEEEEEQEEPAQESETQEDAFPITLQGKEGALRVLVTSGSKVMDLVKYYVAQKNVVSPNVSAEFDGERIGPTQLVGDLELEEDDRLDIHT